MTIRAIHFPDATRFRALKTPGSFHIDLTKVAEDGTLAMWFFCPCGCAHPSRIRIGKDVKPQEGPSWLWNGSLSEPTLAPSVRQLNCGWHGWLRSGYWEAV